jgi:VIT1/CCC1 family predicted Fe2+/Mn2+ transporter
MRLPTASVPDYAELNHQPPLDPLRQIFTNIVFSLRRKREARAEKLGNKSYNFAMKRAMRIANSITRFLVAILGGAVLLVPIVLMSFLDSRNAHLIITSLFTIVFALGMSVVSTATNQEVLAATAAYTAVLVVFVGTASPTTVG